MNARVLWVVDYRGRRALKLAPREGHEHEFDQAMAAVLTESDFQNGVIEVDVSGARRSGYSTTADSTGFESGAWTKVRIEVSGTTARLYVNGAAEPCLVVNDLKHGESHGQIALWARISSDAYFSNLRVEST